MKTKHTVKEKFEPLVEIKIRIAQIAGILNSSAVSDTGQVMVAQQKLGDILELLDQLIQQIRKVDRDKIKKVLKSLKTTKTGAVVCKLNGEGIGGNNVEEIAK